MTNATDNARAQKLGDLIRRARRHADRSEADCARQLGLTPEALAAIEQGEQPISLPELEVLALYLNVPMTYFWGSADLPPRAPTGYADYIALRQRVIGVLLRQLRLDRRQTAVELAAASDIDEAQLAAYEAGAAPIPYLHLEQLSRALEASVDHFVDDSHGPLARHAATHRLLHVYRQLPPPTQAFLLNPSHASFLETARRLSEMDVDRLRQIAESILDITY
jgi:transcriptional regulator with XRE-family HTH domain